MTLDCAIVLLSGIAASLRQVSLEDERPSIVGKREGVTEHNAGRLLVTAA